METFFKAVRIAYLAGAQTGLVWRGNKKAAPTRAKCVL
jgi:hypothetical protein